MQNYFRFGTFSPELRWQNVIAQNLARNSSQQSLKATSLSSLSNFPGDSNSLKLLERNLYKDYIKFFYPLILNDSFVCIYAVYGRQCKINVFCDIINLDLHILQIGSLACMNHNQICQETGFAPWVFNRAAAHLY